MSYEETRATRRVVRRVKVPSYSDEGSRDTPENNDYYGEVPETKPVRMRSMSRVQTEYCIACGKENPVGEQCSCGYIFDNKFDDFRWGLEYGLYLVTFSWLGLLFLHLKLKDRTFKYCPYCGACIGKYEIECANCGDRQPMKGALKFVVVGVMSAYMLVINALLFLQGGFV